MAIEEFLPGWSLEPLVRSLQALRGVDLIVAVTFAAEVGDLTSFENPRQRLMRYLGLVPSERSTGSSVRRCGITKASNSRVRHMLVESAWTYRPKQVFWQLAIQNLPQCGKIDWPLANA